MPETWRNIWVISDTHLSSGKFLPKSFVERVIREDLIIHLGDYISLDVIESLESLAALEGVHGNCDPPSIKTVYPSHKIIEIDDVKVALTHGSGGISGTMGAIRRKFEGKVDIVLFGHTHKTCHFRSGGTLFFNPGSLTSGRGNGRGYGLLHLDQEPWAEFVELPNI